MKISSEAALINTGVTKEEIDKREQRNRLLKNIPIEIRKPSSPFISISNTNLKQLQFFGCNEKDIGKKYAAQFEEFFSKCGFDGKNKGIELLSVKAHILCTATNDYLR